MGDIAMLDPDMKEGAEAALLLFPLRQRFDRLRELVDECLHYGAIIIGIRWINPLYVEPKLSTLGMPTLAI